MDEKPKYWYDIVLAIEAIEHHLKNVSSFEEYLQNITVKDAVERRLIIIGEAMTKIMSLDPDHSIISAYEIRSVRNRLVHAYGKTNDKIIWGVIEDHLPELKEYARRMTSSP
jgi:uncharacterized protein with HEPN domain